MDPNANQRATNVQIRSDIKNLSERVGEMREELREDKKQRAKEMREDKERTTQRFNLVERHVVECSTLWRKHDLEHTRINGEMGDIKTDVKKWSGVGGMVGGIGAILTSIFLDRTP